MPQEAPGGGPPPSGLPSHAKYVQFGAYHWQALGRPSIYQRHALFVSRWVRERPVLDIGCGDGCLTALLDADGIDTSPEAIALGQQYGARVQLGSAYDPPRRWVEAVLLSDVLEHLRWPDVAVRVLRHLTRTVYVSVPYRIRGLYTDEQHFQWYDLTRLDALFQRHGWHRTFAHVANLKWYATYARNHRLYLRDWWERHAAGARNGGPRRALSPVHGRPLAAG